VQTATFVPHGIFGLAYWYSILPFHAWIFPGMLRGIRTSAERIAAGQAADGRDGASASARSGQNS
jgi:hypothetical protein